MKRLYVCSKLRSNETHSRDTHQERAREYAHYLVEQNKGAPFAPHLLNPQFLDDSIEAERTLGVEVGKAYMDVCDEIHVFVDGEENETMSDGMYEDIRYANELQIPIHTYWRTENGTIEPLMDVMTKVMAAF